MVTPLPLPRWSLPFLLLGVPLLAQTSPVRVAGGDFATVTRMRHEANATAPLVVPHPGPPADPVRTKVGDYAAEIRKTQDLLEMVSTLPPARLDERTEDAVLLFNQAAALETANGTLAAGFAEVRARLGAAGHAEVFLERHDAAVAEHEISHLALLDLLAVLRDNFGDPISRHTAIADLKEWFIHRPARVEPPLSQDDPTNREPVERRLELAEMGLDENGVPQDAEPPDLHPNDAPNDADLDPSLETPFTAELQALAAELDHSPLKIFNFVRGNIAFDPYVGSRRGAVETLRLQAGNDMDQASLLIALLRISGVPARYASGQVKMSAEAATNWLGLVDPATAGSLLATAGLEGTTVYDGGEVAHILARRVWVEAHLPFTDYRGTGAGEGEPLWIPLDPAFKPFQNNFGIDPLAGSPPLDIDQRVMDYFQDLEIETFETIFGQDVDARLKATDPALTVSGNALSRTIDAPPLPVLPASLPNTALTRDEVFPTVPDDQRFRIRFLIQGGGSTLDHTVFLPEIAGKQLTLSYIGATAADQNAITGNGGLTGISAPWTIKVRPQLRLDGCVIATGSGSVTLGILQDSHFTFTPPDRPPETIQNTIHAGVYQGLAIGTGRSVARIAEPELDCPEDNTGRLQHLLGTQYLEMNDRSDRQVAGWLQGAVWKGVSNAILGQQVKVAFSGGTPLTFDYAGLYVDADRAGATFFSAYGENRNYIFGRARGVQSSQNENLVFEVNLGNESVSTIKILSLAAAAGIPIYEITPANGGTFLPLLNQPASVYNAVVAELNAGKHVTIPRDQIIYNRWGGTGYIHLDPVNGTGGYIISGGISGGATTEDDEEPGCDKVDRIDVLPKSPGNVYTTCQTGPIFINAYLTSYDSECDVAGAPTREITIDPQSIGPGTYTYKFGSPGDCGCGVKSVDIVIKESPVQFKDSNGRASAGGLLEIAATGSEKVTGTVVDGPPATTWLGSNGATPPMIMGPTATFDVDIPNNSTALPNSLLPVPAMTFMLFPSSPAKIEATGLAEACGTAVDVFPFPSNEFEFSYGLGGPSGAAQNNAGAFGKLAEILEKIDTVEDTLQAIRDVAQRLQSPVELPKIDSSKSLTVKDGIGEIAGSNRILYKLDAGLQGEFGLMGEIPLIGAYVVGIPPQLANVVIFVPVKVVTGLRLAGVAEFRRDLGWVNAIYPEATLYLSGTIGIGARGSIASGVVSMEGSGTTTVVGRVKANPTVAGKRLTIDATFEAEAGDLTLSYKIGVLWGAWDVGGSWKALDAKKFPSDSDPPLQFNFLDLTFP